MHTCQGHTVFTIHSRHEAIDFACSTTLSHQKMKHTSLLFFFLSPFPMLDEHTLHYAHLQSNKETTVWTCAFSLYLSPTLQLAVSILNSVASFCKECLLWRVFSFHLTAPHRLNINFNFVKCCINCIVDTTD